MLNLKRDKLMSSDEKKYDKENKKNDKNESRADEWMMSADHHLHTTEWFGALFFYLVNFGKKKMKQIATEKNIKKNRLVGYFVQLFAFLLLVYLLFVFYIKP